MHMEALKRACEEIEFYNVWTYSRKIMNKDVNDNKIKTYNSWKINVEGLLQMTIIRNHLSWKTILFTYFFVLFWRFWVGLPMQLLFICMSFLSFTGKTPLIFYFKFIFCFETMSQGIFLISLFFSCHNISTLTTYLMMKHVYIFFHVSSITNGFNQLQYDE